MILHEIEHHLHGIHSLHQHATSFFIQFNILLNPSIVSLILIDFIFDSKKCLAHIVEIVVEID